MAKRKNPGGLIREARLAKKMTVKELAQASKLSHGTIERMEAGESTTVRSLEAAAKVLGIPMAQIFSESK